MGTIANAKVTHYYNCYNGDFIGCLQIPSPTPYNKKIFPTANSYRHHTKEIL